MDLSGMQLSTFLRMFVIVWLLQECKQFLKKKVGIFVLKGVHYVFQI